VCMYVDLLARDRIVCQCELENVTVCMHVCMCVYMCVYVCRVVCARQDCLPV
jgi:hypothetical protein